MTYAPVNSVNDLMRATAEAIESRDADHLSFLIRNCREWLQTAEETSAQVAMLEAVQALIMDCEDLL